MGGCSIGRHFWEKIGLNSLAGMAMDSIHTFSPPTGVPKEGFSALVALSCWQLWKTRNAAIFRNEQQSITQVLAACKATAEQWRCRFPRKKRHVVDQWCQFFETARQGWTIYFHLITYIWHHHLGDAWLLYKMFCNTVTLHNGCFGPIYDIRWGTPPPRWPQKKHMEKDISKLST